jgi:hypothetical protein
VCDGLFSSEVVGGKYSRSISDTVEAESICFVNEFESHVNKGCEGAIFMDVKDVILRGGSGILTSFLASLGSGRRGMKQSETLSPLLSLKILWLSNWK